MAHGCDHARLDRKEHRDHHERCRRSPGQLHDATSFDSSNDYIDAGSALAIDDVFTGGATLETWFLAKGWGESNYGRFMDKGHFGGWSFGVNRADSSLLESVFFVHAATSGSYGHWNTAAGSVTLNAWHHVAVVYDKGALVNDATIYLDGTALPITEFSAPGQSGISDASQPLIIGNRPGADRTFNGLLDEQRISFHARSAGWIATTHRNQRAPETFSTFGPELSGQ